MRSAKSDNNRSNVMLNLMKINIFHSVAIYIYILTFSVMYSLHYSMTCVIIYFNSRKNPKKLFT